MRFYNLIIIGTSRLKELKRIKLQGRDSGLLAAYSVAKNGFAYCVEASEGASEVAFLLLLLGQLVSLYLVPLSPSTLSVSPNRVLPAPASASTSTSASSQLHCFEYYSPRSASALLYHSISPLLFSLDFVSASWFYCFYIYQPRYIILNRHP